MEKDFKLKSLNARLKILNQELGFDPEKQDLDFTGAILNSSTLMAKNGEMGKIGESGKYSLPKGEGSSGQLEADGEETPKFEGKGKVPVLNFSNILESEVLENPKIDQKIEKEPEKRISKAKASKNAQISFTEKIEILTTKIT
jgi:hypothetical protein